MDIQYKNKRPTPEEYNNLRVSVGWNRYDNESSALAIKGSSYFILAYNENEIVGMGRVISDGCLCFYILDVIIKPEYQRIGIGSTIMEKILNYINDNAGENAHIGLNSALGKEAFYKKFGFFVRPTDKYGPGMSRFWKKQNN